jgi:hypothetical protein
MSRRSGQNGCIQEDGNWYVVRFWKDVAGQQKRQRVRARICRTSVSVSFQHLNGNAGPKK